MVQYLVPSTPIETQVEPPGPIPTLTVVSAWEREPAGGDHPSSRLPSQTDESMKTNMQSLSSLSFSVLKKKC